MTLTRFVLTLLVMYGHSFQLVGNKQTGLEPIFYTFLKHDIAIVACSILFFISGILSTKSIIEHHQSMVKFLMKIPKLYYTKSHFPLEISQRAFDHLWRVCESFEMWCKETNQEDLIYLNIIE